MNNIINWLLSIFGVALLVILMVFGVLLIIKYCAKELKQPDKAESAETTESVPQEEKFPYVLNNPIMSPKEKSFYRAVKPIANELGLTVFCKIRLADLLNVPKNISKWQTWFNYIKAKHVDFVLVDNDMNIKVIIEVDDKTHSRDDRKQRDEFLDKAFKQLALEVLHIYSWGTNYGGVDLKATIMNALKPADQSEPVS
ncbi:MAG: DUF2726 domain-containing protein [Oscillospiraceae bacterium]